MTGSDQVVAERRHYSEHRPYPDPPAKLAELTGPTNGSIELPITIDWGPNRLYDMGRDSDRRVVYEIVLQEAGSRAGKPLREWSCTCGGLVTAVLATAGAGAMGSALSRPH